MFSVRPRRPGVRQQMPRTIICARLGSLHQLFHQVLVRQGVHFQHDAAGLPGPGLFDLLVDQLRQAVFQAEGRHEQVLAMLHEVAGQQAAEDLLHVGEDALVGGEESQIRIQLGRDLVEVARAHLGDAAALCQADEEQLAVHLVAG